MMCTNSWSHGEFKLIDTQKVTCYTSFTKPERSICCDHGPGWIPKIGEVYLMEFFGEGSVQNGVRPGVVIQNNKGNRHSPNVIALPITTALKKLHQPTHVLILARDTRLKRDSIVLCENPCCVPKNKIGEYVSTLSKPDMARIAIGHALATASLSYLDIEDLFRVWKSACELNKTT